MGRCSAEMAGAPDYCECSWDQMQKLFSEEEMNSDTVDKGKLESFRQRVTAVCMSKLPEPKKEPDKEPEKKP